MVFIIVIIPSFPLFPRALSLSLSLSLSAPIIGYLIIDVIDVIPNSMNMKANNLCILLEKVDAEFKDQLVDEITLEEAKLVVEVLGKINGRWHGQEKANSPMVAFINQCDSAPYKLFGGVADGHMPKVDRYTQGGKGWSYVLPRSYVGMWPDFKASDVITPPNHFVFR